MHHVTYQQINIVRFHETLYQWMKFELHCTLKRDLHVQVMMILIVKTVKCIISSRYDDELLVDLMKVLSIVIN